MDSVKFIGQHPYSYERVMALKSVEPVIPEIQCDKNLLAGTLEQFPGLSSQRTVYFVRLA